jgi:hypothetical protein
MPLTGLLGSYVVVTTVAVIPFTFRKRKKIAIPKRLIALVALYMCVRAIICVCVCLYMCMSAGICLCVLLYVCV